MNRRLPRDGLLLHPPKTLRLTADLVVASSRCKHDYLDARKPDYRVNWGDFGGTPFFRAGKGESGLPVTPAARVFFVRLDSLT